MPSGRANRLRALGANQRDCSHCLISPVACSLGTLAGRRPSGAMSGSAALACATRPAPQNGQTPATCGGSNATTLPQPSQLTCSAWPVSGCNLAAPAATNSSKPCGDTDSRPLAPARATVWPQNGHFIPPVAGSNCISAAQPGHGNCAAFFSGVIREVYCCAPPHSEQKCAARGMGLPQEMQNLVVPPAAGAGGAASGAAEGAGAGGCMAPIICCAIARPAPKPTPAPAAPPPSFAAAIGIDCATWNCV